MKILWNFTNSPNFSGIGDVLVGMKFTAAQDESFKPNVYFGMVKNVGMCMHY